MTEPINLQSFLGLAPLSQAGSQAAQKNKVLFPFPMQNLAVDSQLDQSLAAVAGSSAGRISLSPQSFAAIISEAVVKAVTSVVGMFLEKILPLLGSTTAKTGAAAGAVEAGATGESENTPESGSASTTEASSGTKPAETGSRSPLDFIKSIFNKITDFFGGSSGLGEIFKDVLTTLIPGGVGAKILTKIPVLGKLFSGVLNFSDGLLGSLVKKSSKLLDSIFPGGSDVVKGLVDKGKKLLNKIF